MRVTKELKNNKGITLVSLIITIVVMVIISSVTLYTSMDRFEMNSLQKLYNDIELLSDKVSNYYLKYNGLPVLRNSKNEIIKYSISLEFENNKNDEGNYYILDLEAMNGLSLNYGEGVTEILKISENMEVFEIPDDKFKDIFIINETTHQIYYVKGVESEGVMYHTIFDKTSDIEDTIPPTKPEIKIVSGKLNNDKTQYVTEVQIEIVPGKDNWSGVDKTTYSYDFIDNDGNTEQIQNEKIIKNKIIKLENNGTYKFTVITLDIKGNESKIEKEIIINIPGEISE